VDALEDFGNAAINAEITDGCEFEGPFVEKEGVGQESPIFTTQT